MNRFNTWKCLILELFKMFKCFKCSKYSIFSTGLQCFRPLVILEHFQVLNIHVNVKYWCSKLIQVFIIYKCWNSCKCSTFWNVKLLQIFVQSDVGWIYKYRSIVGEILSLAEIWFNATTAHFKMLNAWKCTLEHL